MSEGGRPHHRTPTEEELALWAHAMRDAKALKPKRAIPSAADEESGATAERPAPESALTLQTPLNPPVTAKPVPLPVRKAPIGALDRRQARLIAKGRAAIDARLDLHGMRQREAYAALRSFLISARNRGCRVVLVITGKGKSRGAGDAGFSSSESESGVLRRLVPLWLKEPELSHSVISFGASDARHGGEGALYVRLRKNDKFGRK